MEKFLVLAFVIWVGCFMFGYRVTYEMCWRIVMASELVFTTFLKSLKLFLVRSDRNRSWLLSHQSVLPDVAHDIFDHPRWMHAIIIHSKHSIFLNSPTALLMLGVQHFQNGRSKCVHYYHDHIFAHFIRMVDFLHNCLRIEILWNGHYGFENPGCLSHLFPIRSS